MNRDPNTDLTAVWSFLRKARQHYEESVTLKEASDVEAEMGAIMSAWLMLSSAYEELDSKIKYFVSCDNTDTLEIIVQQLADFYFDLQANTNGKVFGTTKFTADFVGSKAKQTQIKLDVIKGMIEDNKSTCARVKSTCESAMEALRVKAPGCSITVCAHCNKMKKPKY